MKYLRQSVCQGYLSTEMNVRNEE
uniref:Uncharacterized protein n=1 Tax=Anguilla anguilla TaxID=7936 RepID=A0A0E9RVE4_ANGAN